MCSSDLLVQPSDWPCILGLALCDVGYYIRIGEYIGKEKSTSQPNFQGIFGPDPTPYPLSSDGRGDVRWRLSESSAGPSADCFPSLELPEEGGIGGNTKERALGSLSVGKCQVRLSSQPAEVLGQLLSRCS